MMAAFARNVGAVVFLCAAPYALLQCGGDDSTTGTGGTMTGDSTTSSSVTGLSGSGTLSTGAGSSTTGAGGGPNPAGCPVLPPDGNETRCANAAVVVCNYPGNARSGIACSVMYCNGGNWQCQPEGCPGVMPAANSACPGDAPQTCFYDDGSPSGTYCSCQSSRWTC